MESKKTKKFFSAIRRPFLQDQDDTDVFDSDFSKRNIHNISELWPYAVTIVALLLFTLTRYTVRDNLPKALTSTDLLHSDSTFISERAWKDLKILTSFGPRPSGSYSNEVLAVDFLKREILHIKQTAHKNQRIELDVEAARGAYFREAGPLSMTSVYRNVQNVVAKLYGKTDSTLNEQSSNNSLLLNCHFDSAPDSPGASDDAANCVTMLEILRVLSRSKERNDLSIIFLFNGAEETGLQASHGFVTQHKWAKQIKGFINLESAGAGGKEMLFQGTPKSSCMIKAYAQSAAHPSAHVAAEEIFQSGIIPSDTDCRIFRDYGHLTGLDFAYFINGQHYHTKYDHIKYLSMESLQHTGNNILELVKNLANSDCLLNIEHAEQEQQVFFDIFGKIFIAYSASTAKVFNLLVVFGAISVPYLLLLGTTKGVHKKYVHGEIFLGFLSKLISLIAVCIAVYVIAFDLDSNADKSMSWYAHPYICVPTYCLVTVLVQFLIEERIKSKNHSPLSLGLRVQARLIGVCIFWSIPLTVLTVLNIRSAYFIMVPQVVVLFCHILIAVLRVQNTRRKWVYVHLVGQVFIFAWNISLFHSIADVIMATTGRWGADKNPEIIVGFICGLLTFFATCFLTTFSGLIKNCKHFMITLIIIYGITRYYFISHTNYGFPYESEAEGLQPRVQRHLIMHTLRTLYDKEGKTRYTDSGYWMFEYDRNAHKTIESLAMPEKPVPFDKNILCKSEVLCGLPLYYTKQLKMNTFWVPGPKPKLSEVAHVQLLEKEQLSDDYYRLHLVITGNQQLTMQIRPKEGVTLKDWSLMDTVPAKTVYKNQSFYFIVITHGLVEEHLDITLDLQVSDKDSKHSLIDVTLTTLLIGYEKDHTPEFTKLLSRLPAWAYAVPMVADLKSWTF